MSPELMRAIQAAVSTNTTVPKSRLFGDAIQVVLVLMCQIGDPGLNLTAIH